MPVLETELPITFRQEVVAPLFELIQTGESCAVVGIASVGKSRLLRFLLRADVQHHYLGDAATWLVLVDCHRLAEVSEWGLYELLLTTLTEAASDRLHGSVRDWLSNLRRDVITATNPLLARRNVELATHVLCHDHAISLCFICDEFDAVYSTLPPQALANLRALRDIDRYQICYALMLRNHPAQLRSPDEVEGFYELFSRSVLGLKPLAPGDAHYAVAQLAARRHRPVSAAEAATLLELSGCHSGLLIALFDVLLHTENGFPSAELTAWGIAQHQIIEECRKLWAGLTQAEQIALSRLPYDIAPAPEVRKSLLLKGLICPHPPGKYTIFGPLFAAYVRNYGNYTPEALRLDAAAAVVWVEGRKVDDLSSLEFQLLRYLYRKCNQLCTREEILAALYPGEHADPQSAAADNRIDSLVSRLRKAIEPVPDQPRYLLTVRGLGYKLVGCRNLSNEL